MAEQTIDRDVIAACQDGDREAFRLLFELYKDKVFSIAVYSFSGDRTIADDVTQQIFLKLFTVIRQFRGHSEFTTWLYRLVINACVDERRRRKHLLPWGEAMPGIDQKKRPDNQYAKLEVAEAVRAAIAQLKPSFRTPVLLKYIDGLSYEEIAAVMGCSKGTVASRLNRAHAELARRLVHLKAEVSVE
ncbi:MAG: RNA polymerase sigma factor [Pyrinomonadaceae bacterium]